MTKRLLLSTLLLCCSLAIAEGASDGGAIPFGIALPETDQSGAAELSASQENKEKEPVRGGKLRVLISPDRQARLSAMMAGRLVSMPLKAGAAFRKGDLLAGFDCSEAKAEHDMASARLAKATYVLESQKSLQALGAVSDLDLEIAGADVREAEARVKQTGVVVDRCRITAPYDGRVVRLTANQFEMINPGTPVIEIVESANLHLEMFVPSRWLGWLKNGHIFSLKIDELGIDAKARVTTIGSRVDPVSQTVLVRAELVDRPAGVLPGMSGYAMIGEPD
ncbi:MAG: efflux RND transporter periplasmic adaptor subunit [Alcanivoracaceae bacterium]|nr:efflux RND transporter periplasmic adaptor subunit [Alcanivoracaceae bacterium]